MKPEELAQLVALAKAGKVAGLGNLMASLQRQVRAFTATFAVNQAMVDHVFIDTWNACIHSWSQAPEPHDFVRWLHQLARTAVQKHLEEAGREAVDRKDALSHVAVSSGLERLHGSVSMAHETAAAVNARINELPKAAKSILARRYNHQAGRAAIAAELRLDEGDVAYALFTAREKLEWMDGSTNLPDSADRLFAMLIEDFLEGVITGEERAQLANDLVAHLDLSTVFIRQVRVDLVLRALLEPDQSERARDQALTLLGTARHERAKAVSDRHSVQRSSQRRRIPSDSLRVVGFDQSVPERRGESSGATWAVVGAALVLVAIIAMIANMGGSASPISMPSEKHDAAPPTQVAKSSAAPVTPQAPDTNDAERKVLVAKSVAIRSPGDGAVFETDQRISVDVSAAAGSDRIRKVELTFDDRVVAERRSPPYGFMLEGGEPGTHSLRAVMTDLDGAVTQSAPISIAISAPRPVLPTPEPSPSEPEEAEQASERKSAPVVPPESEKVPPKSDAEPPTKSAVQAKPEQKPAPSEPAKPVATPITYGGKPFRSQIAVIPGTIEAECYDEGGEGVAYHDCEPQNLGGKFRADGVDVQINSSGYEVAYTVSEEWLSYTVKVDSAGYYDLQVTYAVIVDSEISVSVGSSSVYGVPLPATADWSTFGNAVVSGVRLDAGKQIMKVFHANGIVIDKLAWRKTGDLPKGKPPAAKNKPFGGTPLSVPGVIQAENYDLGGEGIAYHDSDKGNDGSKLRNDDVDVGLSDTGACIGWFYPGEWVVFTVEVAKDGVYDLTLRASSLTASVMDLRIDDANVVLKAMPATGDWMKFQELTVPGVKLKAGRQCWTVHSIGPGAYNFDCLTVNEGKP